MKRETRTAFILSLVVATAALLSFANNLGNDWAYDDIEYITHNTFVTESGHTGDIFSTTYLYGVNRYQTALYRPLSILSYTLNRMATGMNPGAFHAVNDLLHAANSVIVLHIVTLISGGNVIAFPAALFFATHPIHTEAVDNVVGRAELLAFLFMMLSLLFFFRRERKSSIMYPLSLVFFFAALLCKETPIVLPAIIIVDFLGRRFRGEAVTVKKALLETGGFFAVAAIYQGLRNTAVVYGGDVAAIMMHDNPLASLGFFERLPTALTVVWRYVWLSIFPAKLSADYSFNQIPAVESLLSLGALAGAAVVIALFAGGIISAKRSPAVFTGILLFSMPFLVMSNILFPIGTIMGERLMYIPSLGYVILITAAISFLVSAMRLKSSATLWIAIGLSLLFAGRTIIRNADWKNNDTIFEKTAATAPQSVKAAYNYALVLKNRGRLEDAITQYRKAVAIWPEHQSAWFNMGNTLRETGRLDEAVTAYERAAALLPDDPGTLRNLALAYRDLKQPEKAVAVFEKIRALTPDDPSVELDIGNTWASSGNYDRAMETYHAILDSNPQSSDVMINIGNVCTIRNDTLAAMSWFDRALEAEPSSPAANNAVVGILIARGRFDEAAARIERMKDLRIPVRKRYIEAILQHQQEKGR